VSDSRRSALLAVETGARPVGPLPPGRGLLVVGHGTADATGAGETREIAALVAARLSPAPVELGFLEVIGPSIAEALAALARRGCREVVAAPLLLFAAGHARRDVPEAIASAASGLGLEVRQTDPFGLHPGIVELSRRRRAQAVADRGPVAASATTLVMVGRGSSDATAASQLAELTAASLADEPAPGRVLTGFVAAASPTLSEAIAAASDPSDDRVRRIIVQPHLLFHGHVETQVTAAVAEGRRIRPTLEWIQVSRLGADPLVAAAVLDRAAAVSSAWRPSGGAP